MIALSSSSTEQSSGLRALLIERLNKQPFGVVDVVDVVDVVFKCTYYLVTCISGLSQTLIALIIVVRGSGGGSVVVVKQGRTNSRVS